MTGEYGDYFSNVCWIAGWEVITPAVKSTNAANGIVNPIPELVTNDNMYLCGTIEEAETLLAYIQKQYNIGSKVDEVQEAAGRRVFKFE